MKQGADKHRITENSEILSLFQDSGSYQPDAAEVNGKEFKVTIPRTIPNGSLKDRNTTQKTDVTTQKDSLKDSNTILKALEPIQAEVLKYIMAHPQATREEIADSIDGISFGGVKFIIAKLQKKGLLKRVGGRKHGEWQVLI